MTGDNAVVTVGSHAEVTSQGSLMYVFRSTLTGDPDAGTSHSCTVLGVTVRAAIRSDVCARIIPVVEKPSSAAKPMTAASTLPFESLQTPCASSVPCANVHAASGVSLPQAAHEVDTGLGSRSRSMGSGTMLRAGSTTTTVETGAMAKVVIAASSWCGKTWLIAGNAAWLYPLMI